MLRIGMSHSFAVLEVLLLAHRRREAERIAVVVLVVGVARGREEHEVVPAAFARPGEQPEQRRLGDDEEVDPLRGVPRHAVEAVEEVRAARARALALGSVHEAVQRQAVLARANSSESFIGTGCPSALKAFEDVVLRHGPARWQGTALAATRSTCLRSAISSASSALRAVR
jgi:hypothetical protein